MDHRERNLADKCVVIVAEGFGIGRSPFAPGTFGTGFGFIWIFLLLWPQSLWFYLAGMIGGLLAAVWIGSRAEIILGLKDPGSIVIDEITALPLAFLPAVFWTVENGAARPFSFYCIGQNVSMLAVTFAAFRLFDIAKPLGIRRVQALPGGWGLVLDDVLAAAAAGLVLLGFLVIWK